MYQINELALSVTNVAALASGCVAQIMCKDTLLIGSATSAQWHLDDSNHQVQAKHCEIQRVDGVFCIIDLCAGTYVNGATSPLGIGQRAKLNVGDEFCIGSLHLSVALEHSAQERLENIDTLLDASLSSHQSEPLIVQQAPIPDPLIELDALFAKSQKTNNVTDDLLSDVSSSVKKEDRLSFTPQSDSEFELSSSMTLKKHRTDFNLHSDAHSDGDVNTQWEKLMEPLQPETGDRRLDMTLPQGDEHLLASPMMSGLGVPLSGKQNVTQWHELAHDIGESLQACIKGVLAIHEQVKGDRFGTLNRNLQPIEDNPLRLGLSYQETIQTLFDDSHSSVHLSPPAAISESLKQVRNHHDAMLHATSVALEQILVAFSPEVLLRRFSQYRRATEPHSQETGSWAWQMYNDYYQELTSFRQQGFEKLYWEIFEQAYDQKIREMQREC
ncbi:type VI secretion system-associated FHA domain protein TagH [Vibrio maritimus]|uniref:type VI secretion system-associated FHA domain protein TagH n=1 Tax=Vibrio maritimus TaxID=990268 RepID=UPI001F23339D|nr:type VI secretion system-associated FHA domain protein TagH [Vibrio maritimus]